MTEALAREAAARLKSARSKRDQHKQYWDDGWRYCLPWRSAPDASEPHGTYHIDDSIGMYVVRDWASDMQTTFTPPMHDWMDFELTQAGQALLQAQSRTMRNEFMRLFTVWQNGLFQEIRRSSFAQAVAEGYKDLAVGTMALMIETPSDVTRPMRCQAIPLSQLLIDHGPDRLVDFRAREVETRLSLIETLWPDAKIDADLRHRIDSEQASGQQQKQTVTECYWRRWDRRDAEVWQEVVLLGGQSGGDKVLRAQERMGPGACPIIVARWETDPSTPWGFGPANYAMPDIRTANWLRNQTHDANAFAIRPPMVADDDGVFDASVGIKPGALYYKAPGSQEPRPMYPTQARLEFSIVQLDAIHQDIRRAFFQDSPQQIGRTPPTATQWRDMAADKAKRLGIHADQLVVELQIPVVQRFAALLGGLGKLPSLDIEGENVMPLPQSPLVQAQDEEEAQRMVAAAQQIQSIIGPEMSANLINQPNFARALFAKYNLPEELIADEEEFQRTLQQMQAPRGAAG